MMQRKFFALFAFLLMSLAIGAQMVRASEEEKPVKVDYRFTPPAPREQSEAEMMAKSDGCYSCHVRTDRPTMHATPAVRRGCTDCHGGDASQIVDPKLGYDDPANKAVMARAHPRPTLPGAWHDSSPNPPRRYTVLNKEPTAYKNGRASSRERVCKNV